jgi:hypothetical protein
LAETSNHEKKKQPHLGSPYLKKAIQFQKKNIARVAIRHVQQGISVNYTYILYFIISLQGTVSPDGYFFEGLNILISTFGVCADGFRALSRAFHYPIQLITFYSFFEITY